MLCNWHNMAKQPDTVLDTWVHIMVHMKIPISWTEAVSITLSAPTLKVT